MVRIVGKLICVVNNWFRTKCIDLPKFLVELRFWLRNILRAPDERDERRVDMIGSVVHQNIGGSRGYSSNTTWGESIWTLFGCSKKLEREKGARSRKSLRGGVVSSPETRTARTQYNIRHITKPVWNRRCYSEENLVNGAITTLPALFSVTELTIWLSTTLRLPHTTVQEQESRKLLA